MGPSQLRLSSLTRVHTFPYFCLLRRRKKRNKADILYTVSSRFDSKPMELTLHA